MERMIREESLSEDGTEGGDDPTEASDEDDDDPSDAVDSAARRVEGLSVVGGREVARKPRRRAQGVSARVRPAKMSAGEARELESERSRRVTRQRCDTIRSSATPHSSFFRDTRILPRDA